MPTFRSAATTKIVALITPKNRKYVNFLMNCFTHGHFFSPDISKRPRTFLFQPIFFKTNFLLFLDNHFSHNEFWFLRLFSQFPENYFLLFFSELMPLTVDVIQQTPVMFEYTLAFLHLLSLILRNFIETDDIV